MTDHDLRSTLADLMALPAETETVEFKEAGNTFDFTKLGKYFSALSNEANLAGKPCAWLVFGVSDKRQIVGTNYRRNRPDLDHLKGEIAGKTANGISFTEIHEVNDPNGRVILFQIPAAPSGIPVDFEGHYYARNGEEMSPLTIEKLERIRHQDGYIDWSAGVVPTAKLSDLDPKAIEKARQEYKKKNPRTAAEVDIWDDAMRS
jgi:ATP-dependent DNA helicase RecG